MYTSYCRQDAAAGHCWCRFANMAAPVSYASLNPISPWVPWVVQYFLTPCGGSPKKGMSSIKNRGELANQMPSMMCLRCGMFGHMAANCPTKNCSNSPSKKRRADPTENFAGTAQHVISDSSNWVAVDPDACIQDGGASTFLAGAEYVLQYLIGGWK